MCLDRTCFWVFRPVNKPRDASVNQSPGAHRARLDGRINSRADEPIIADLRGGLSQRGDFSVSGRVACGDHGVASSPDDFARKHDDGPDGNLSGVTRGFGFGERFVHELFAGIVHDAFRRAKAIANGNGRYKVCQETGPDARAKDFTTTQSSYPEELYGNTKHCRGWDSAFTVGPQ